MCQLISHIFCIVIVYRVYKHFFSDWTGWHLFLMWWHLAFLGIMGIIATGFWVFITISDRIIGYSIVLISLLLCILFAISSVILTCKIHGLLSEYWWAVTYHYYRYIITYNLQFTFSKKRINSFYYYDNWYLFQEWRKLINFMYLIVYIIFYIWCAWLFCRICLGFIVVAPYHLYWFKMYWLIWSSDKLSWILYINVYIVLKWLAICTRYHIINYGTQMNEVGLVFRRMYWKKGAWKHVQIVFSYIFCYDKSYLNIFIDHDLVEFPINWWNWQNLVLDKYYVSTEQNVLLIKHLILFYIYKKFGILAAYVKHIFLYSFNYDYKWLEQDDKYI